MIKCEGNPLDNVLSFKYLGNIFTTFVDQIHDVKERVSQVMVRFDKLRNILDVKEIDVTRPETVSVRTKYQYVRF